ncbi:glycosyltransferase, partial [Candidatus Uhrbacteria bacterium]|nr:glycosyltransferase [Candidatus Uhrbacteria bacterium]
YTSDAPLVGVIANLYSTKDLGNLLHAAQRVHAEFPTASIVVIGEGRMRSQLEGLRRDLALEQVVHFVGAIPDAWKYWRAFDCAVLSSVKEGLPYTLVEAAVFGVPIVATRVGGIPEIVRDGQTGILVPRRDPRALANALLRVIRDPSWKQRAEAAAHKIRELFSLERMVRETSEMYGR